MHTRSGDTNHFIYVTLNLIHFRSTPSSIVTQLSLLWWELLVLFFAVTSLRCSPSSLKSFSACSNWVYSSAAVLLQSSFSSLVARQNATEAKCATILLLAKSLLHFCDSGQVRLDKSFTQKQNNRLPNSNKQLGNYCEIFWYSPELDNYCLSYKLKSVLFDLITLRCNS